MCVFEFEHSVVCVYARVWEKEGERETERVSVRTCCYVNCIAYMCVYAVVCVYVVVCVCASLVCVDYCVLGEQNRT